MVLRGANAISSVSCEWGKSQVHIRTSNVVLAWMISRGLCCAVSNVCIVLKLVELMPTRHSDVCNLIWITVVQGALREGIIWAFLLPPEFSKKFPFALRVVSAYCPLCLCKYLMCASANLAEGCQHFAKSWWNGTVTQIFEFFTVLYSIHSWAKSPRGVVLKYWFYF